MRLVARRLVFLPHDVLTASSRKGKLLPPKGIIFTGSGDFIEDGKRWLKLFERFGLQRDADFLDIGSGIGRMAVPLTEHILPEARYEGFDIMALGVNWCKKNISKRYPNFNFTLLELRNDLYRSTGEDASQTTFPYGSNRFGMACATSVFTHMLPDEMYHYLEETFRVLRPGGRLVATFFLSDQVPVNDQKAAIKFPHSFDEHALHSLKSEAANVCYLRQALELKCQQIGFRITDVQRGFWRGISKAESLDFQDIVVLEKPI